MFKNNKQIDVSNSSIIRFWLAPVIILAVGALIYWTKTALILIFLAMFLAVALNPLVEFIANKFFNKNRTKATSVTFVGLLLVLVGIGLLIIPSITSQTGDFVKNLPNLVNNLKQHDLINQLGISDEIDNAVNNLVNNREEIIGNVGKKIFSSINSMFSAIFSFVILLTLSFLMLIEGPDILKVFWGFYDIKEVRKHHQKIAEKFYNIITSFVSGQLLVAFVNGLLASVVVLILSLIFPISASLMAPVGVTIGMIGLIPMIGATLGAIVASILIALSSLPAAIVFIIYYTIYQQVENNVIIPLVQSKSLELSVLTVLISVTVGLYLFGVLGGILSIPAAGCIKVLLEENFTFRQAED